MKAEISLRRRETAGAGQVVKREDGAGRPKDAPLARTADEAVVRDLDEEREDEAVAAVVALDRAEPGESSGRVSESEGRSRRADGGTHLYSRYERRSSPRWTWSRSNQTCQNQRLSQPTCRLAEPIAWSVREEEGQRWNLVRRAKAEQRDAPARARYHRPWTCRSRRRRRGRGQGRARHGRGRGEGSTRGSASASIVSAASRRSRAQAWGDAPSRASTRVSPA